MVFAVVWESAAEDGVRWFRCLNGRDVVQAQIALEWAVDACSVITVRVDHDIKVDRRKG